MRYGQAGLGRRRRVWAASIGLAVMTLLAACAGSGSTSQPPLAQATGTATPIFTSTAIVTSTAQPTNTPRPTPTHTPRPRATATPTPRPRPTPTPTTVMVQITTDSGGNFVFSPANVTIRVGSSVEWINNTNGVPHTSTSDTGVWNSGMKLYNYKSTFTFTFTSAGSYGYMCTIHPYMTGTITVTS
jgi:plastocyanin